MKSLPWALLLLLLAGSPAWAAKPIWLTSYHDAYRQTQAVNKPLLVVLDDPNDHDRRVEQVALTESSTDPDVLAKYTLCHIDVSTSYGQKIAASFETTEFPQTVIIDKFARQQIFRKAGRFSSAEWKTTLIGYEKGEARVDDSPRPRARICFT